jgi:CheY-like chemotaxis protein
MSLHGSKGKPRVVFVDDDKLITRFYKEVLVEDHGYTVEVYHRVGIFMDKLRQDRNWDAVVLDVMMPHSDYADLDYGQTDDGLLTGVFLAQKVRILMPQVPIVILTNRVTEDISGYLKEVAQLEIKSKFELPPFEFADYLNQRLKVS